MTTPVTASLNTSVNVQVNRPEAPAKKEWDEMTAPEQAAERAKAQAEISKASVPDPVKDREIDRVLGKMKEVFADQERHPITLFQTTGAMKNAGHKDMPPVILGINGYNFVIPRGVPVNLPEAAISILYEAGEISPQAMVALGLRTAEDVSTDLAAQNEVNQMIQDKIKPMEF